MNMQFPPDIRTSLDAFLVGGQFQSEEDVLREALAALKYRGDLTATLQQGLEDEAAGRTFSARELVAKAKTQLGSAAR